MVEENIGAHSLAIEDVLAAHDSVHGRGVLEGEERETAGPPILVAQDGAVLDLAELSEILSQTVCSLAISLRFGVGSMGGCIPSVVSQLRPPTNILLYSRYRGIRKIRHIRGIRGIRMSCNVS